MALTQEQENLLYSSGIIDLRGQVEEPMTTYVRDCLPILTAHGCPEVTIWITSQGGDIYQGLCIYDMFRTYPGWVNGIVINVAASMAVIILQGCDKRLAHPNALLLIHDPIFTNISVSLLNNGRELRKTLRESDRRLFTRLYEILSLRSQRSIEEVRKKCRQDEAMFADEALEFGLVDELVR